MALAGNTGVGSRGIVQGAQVVHYNRCFIVQNTGFNRLDGQAKAPIRTLSEGKVFVKRASTEKSKSKMSSGTYNSFVTKI